MLCALTKHAAIFGSLWLQYRVFPKGIYRAVLPVREKTIGVIATVEMCEKCSHFRLMMAVEEMKIVQPETCEKYFIYYKENFERPPRGNTLKLTRVVWKSTQTSIICCCLFKRRIFFTCSRTVLKKERGLDNSSFCGGWVPRARGSASSARVFRYVDK